MGISRTVISIYGIRICDDTDWLALDNDPGQCRNSGQVGYIRAGAYDRQMMFLALRWKHVEPGEYILHSGERPNANKFERDRWNSDLHAEADRLGLEIIDGPGWFTMPDEG